MVKWRMTVVRHGETQANRDRILQGQADYPLNKLGQKQANLAAKALAKETYTHVFSSDLTRAMQTAKTIVEKNPKNPAIGINTKLRERGFGVYENKTIEEYTKACKSGRKKCLPEGAETVEEFHQRAVDFWADLCRNLEIEKHIKDKEEPRFNVLIVSHGGLIKEFYLFMHDKLDGHLPKSYKDTPPNTGISEFEVTSESKGSHTVKAIKMNDAEHIAKLDVLNPGIYDH